MTSMDREHDGVQGGGRARWRPWVVLGACSLLLFAITASTFSSLGVVLPRMVQDLELSWSGAGLGFTLLGAFCGGSSLLPALMIRRIGVRSTVLVGSGVMVCGFLLLSGAQMLATYLVATALLGVGYQMMALIPGTHVLAALFKQRGMAFGIYFTLGSLGGVAGPLMALAVAGEGGEGWRQYWLVQAVASAAIGALCAAAIGSRRWLTEAGREMDESVSDALAEASPEPRRIYRTTQDFTVREAVRTPQFYILLAAYFSHLLCGVTVASLSVAHLSERGVAAGLAAAMLSIEGFATTLSRLLGGFLGDRIDPRYLLIASQALLLVGMLTLSVAGNALSLVVFAIGTGAGFGLTVLAVTMLLLNYYGRRHNLEIFSLTCTIGAVSATGPFIGGFMRDRLGEFAPTFQVFAAVMFVILVAAIAMRPPRRAPAAPAAPRLTESLEPSTS